MSNALFPAALLMLTFALAPTVQAEVYKWVDENGQTHYGERKPGAGSKGVSEVKITPPPPYTPPPEPPAKTEEWLRPPKTTAKATKKPEPPQSRTGGREDGTDASRCALAKDVLDGNLRHVNGNPIDKHDIDTAKNDIKLFCKSR